MLRQRVEGGLLIEMLHQGIASVFTLNHKQFIQLIKKTIPESQNLKETVNTTVEKKSENVTAIDYYGLTDAEEIKAFTSLLRFKNVVNGKDQDYEEFVACQKETGKPVLKRESFEAMHQYVKQTLKTPEDYATLIWSILCNDLDKTQKAELKNSPDLFPFFNNLPKTHQNYIIEAYASGCDISQLEQLECPPVSVRALAKLDKKSLQLYFLHSFFLVAGAAAHVKTNGSLTMHEETWNFFNKLRECLEKLSDQYSSEDVYQEYLTYRGQCIGIEQSSNETMALIRIAGLTRLATQTHGQHLLEVWSRLTDSIKKTLIEEFSVHGGKHKRAIFINCGPALLLNPQNALLKQLNDPLKSKGIAIESGQVSLANTNGLIIGLWHLANIFNHARSSIHDDENDNVFVAECEEVVKMLSVQPKPPTDLTLQPCLTANTNRIDYKLIPQSEIDNEINIVTIPTIKQSRLSQSNFFKKVNESEKKITPPTEFLKVTENISSHPENDSSKKEKLIAKKTSHSQSGFFGKDDESEEEKSGRALSKSSYS